MIVEILVEKYIKKDRDFWFEKRADGEDRYPERTFAEKFNEFFYGFRASGKHCKFVYDFESLKLFFEEAGFTDIQRKRYRESDIPGVEETVH